MKHSQKILKRHSVRLKDYDYSQEGAYFITICTVNHSTILGNIENGTINLSPIGGIVQDLWARNPESQSGIEIDQFIIMPNHLHGIIVITEKKESSRMGLINQTPTKWILMQNPAQILGKIIRRFKARASYSIHRARYFDFRWQRNYYEHIIRNDKELNKFESTL